MHARWYQPSTGTFTSRDTMTLTPNPSVQANRYTYANASPLTGIDPTGHATVGRGTSSGDSADWNQGSIDFTSHINRSGSGFGCDPTCFNTPGSYLYSWGTERIGDGIDVVSAGLEWYFDTMIWPNQVLADDEEAKRTGTMPNGMTAPPGFWDMTAGDRAEAVILAALANFLNPSITDEGIALLVGARPPSSNSSGAGGSAGKYKSDIPFTDISFTTALEGAQCYLSPLLGKKICDIAERLAGDAERLTKEWYGYNSKSDGTWRNAFVHTLWSALMMAVLGETAASLIGDIHESVSDKKGYWTQADYHNNRTGRTIGALFKLNRDMSKTWGAKDMGKFILKARKN